MLKGRWKMDLLLKGRDRPVFHLGLRAPKPSEVQGLTSAQCCLTKRRSQPGLIGPKGSIMLSPEPGLRGTGVSPGGPGVGKGVISASILLLNNK